MREVEERAAHVKKAKVKQTRSSKEAPGAARDLAPSELRYQFLRAGPGRDPVEVWGIACVIGSVVGCVLAVVTGRKVAFSVAAPVALLVSFVLRNLARLRGPSKDFRAVPVSVVPWGILLDPDGAPAPVPWQRLREVHFTRVQRDWKRLLGGRDSDPGSPDRVIAIFDTDAGAVQAVGEDGEWITAVSSSAPRLRRAAARLPAADLGGTEPLDAGGMPVTLALLRRAEAILASADERASLGLPVGDYRTTSTRTAGPETCAALRGALQNGHATCDPGALAAVLVAELGITDLLPDLLRLVLSPSPLLAAVAKAAALRLGASRMVAGSLDEVGLFLPEPALAELRRWIGPNGDA